MVSSSYLLEAVLHEPLVTKLWQRELWPAQLEIAVSMGRRASTVEVGIGFGFRFGFESGFGFI